ncbi:MAG: ATP-binding protein [Cyanobacteriota bacterium]|nr:ATP-binding protein [Cyanobacteriota bacterium]
MSSYPTPLQHFIRAVPICQQTTAVSEVWSIFCREKCDRVIAINLENHPVGVVYLQDLIEYLFPPSSEAHTPKGNAQQSLLHLDPPLIEPLISISAALTWEEFWQHFQHINFLANLQENPQENSANANTLSLVLVSPDHQVLGLLDQFQLLQFLVSNPQIRQPTLATSDPENLVETVVENTSTAETSPSLLHLIEQLPIPLMIQRENGETLAQNQTWRSEVELDFQSISETSKPLSSEPASEASVHLSTRPDSESSASDWAYSHLQTDQPERNTCDFSMFTMPPSSTEATASVSENANFLPDWSPVDSSGDTYICVCSLPNRHERVWQFLRQPLRGDWARSLSSEQPQFWIVIAQDITEQHRVAQELAAKNADLVHLNRLKDEFLACISHELKTPLTAVLGLSSLLKDQALGSLNDRQARYAQLIHRSGRHLMMVVNDILDLTRMETGQLELIPEPVNIRAVCERAFEMALQHQSNTASPQKTSASTPSTVSDSAASTPAQERFILEIEPNLETIVADELRLRQMLVNLLSNALKFTSDDSEIGLQVNHWENWIGFTVWDKGIGIPEDKQHLIFQKFQQLESPLTRKFEGTGLGLVLTQRLARLHGGDVSFISKHNQGSQFTLLLPPSPPERKDWGLDTRDWHPSHPTAINRRSSINPPRPTPEIQSRLVLIVEAAPRYISSLSEHLTNLGYRVVIARSGTEALEKARCLQPRIIFLNPLLPLLSGWDVLTLLKTNTYTHQIPVVITATLGDKKRAKLNNSDGFLSLPVQKPELQEILKELKQDSLSHPAHRLTLLWLNPVEENSQSSLSLETQSSPLNAEMVENSIYHSALILHHFSSCRILEADDLNQAELLARIWNPDAIILQSTTGVENPTAFLQELSTQKILANLPLITLDQSTTEIANHIEKLSVFPCLISDYLERSETENSDSSQTLESALLQVIQVAVGMNWKPNILLVDFSILSDFQPSHSSSRLVQNQTQFPEVEENSPPSETADTADNEFKTKIDQALVQYLQTAGFRGVMAQSLSQVYQQVQYQNIDLLLICTRDLSPKLMEILSTLERISTELSILILNQSNLSLENFTSLNNFVDESETHLNQNQQNMTNKLEIKVLPGQISTSDLLEQIKQILHDKNEKEKL